MPLASEFPVSFPYAATTAPYSPTHPHTGDDHKMPLNTPIDVGSAIIGYAGTTGKSTGVHVHVQKYKNGYMNPNGKGLATTIAFPARVIDTGYTAEIGNYVRIMAADGIRWSYFHMNKVNCKVGDIINQGDTQMIIQNADNWFNRCDRTMYQMRGRNLGRDEFVRGAVGNEFLRWVESVSDNPEADQATVAQQTGQIAMRDNWQGRLADSEAWKQKAINEMQPQIEALKLQVDELSKERTIAALEELTRQSNATHEAAQQPPEPVEIEGIQTVKETPVKTDWLLKFLQLFFNKK